VIDVKAIELMSRSLQRLDDDINVAHLSAIIEAYEKRITFIELRMLSASSSGIENPPELLRRKQSSSIDFVDIYCSEANTMKLFLFILIVPVDSSSSSNVT